MIKQEPGHRSDASSHRAIDSCAVHDTCLRLNASFQPGAWCYHLCAVSTVLGVALNLSRPALEREATSRSIGTGSECPGLVLYCIGLVLRRLAGLSSPILCTVFCFLVPFSIQSISSSPRSHSVPSNCHLWPSSWAVLRVLLYFCLVGKYTAALQRFH